MKRILTFAVCLSLLLLQGCKQSGEPTAAQKAAFEMEMDAYLASIEAVGASMAVVKDNKIIYNHNYGVKDLETSEPVDDETMFRIASISKSFSATSMMQLLDQGKVSLDEDVSNLAGFKIRNPKYPDTVITLAMLLSHTSSLNDSQGYFTFNAVNPATNPDGWTKCYNDYEPGTGYEYCNLNFNLVGSFIEKLSGERFDQYVVKHVLNPLGLYGGYCVDSLDKSRFAKLYEWNGSKYIEETDAYAPRSEEIANYTTGYDTPVFSPTGGMKISALDLARYMLMHMNYGKSPLCQERIIKEEYSKLMQTERSEPEHYGFAIMHADYYIDGVNLTGHTGGAYGLRSAMFFDPEQKYGFVIICSGSHNPWSDNANVLRGSIPIMYKHFIAGAK